MKYSMVILANLVIDLALIYLAYLSAHYWILFLIPFSGMSLKASSAVRDEQSEDSSATINPKKERK